MKKTILLLSLHMGVAACAAPTHRASLSEMDHAKHTTLYILSKNTAGQKKIADKIVLPIARIQELP